MRIRLRDREKGDKIAPLNFKRAILEQTKRLIRPLSWEERRPIFKDSVFHIPDRFDRHEEFSLPPWDALFDSPRPLSVEICSGNGQWIAERARRHPEKNWLAVEWQFDRVKKIWSKRMKGELKNLAIVCGDARLFVRHYLPRGSVEELFVNFPDPWPKKRHAKHRLIQPSFLRDLSPALAPGGKVTLVTDDPAYRDQMVESFICDGLFRPLLDAPHYATDWSDYGLSYFDTLWRSKERTIHYLPFAVSSHG